MQSTVEQILEGNFDYGNGSLDFSCTKLELTLRKGEVFEGSFHVYSARDEFTHGFVTVTDMRMECLTPEFTGSSEEIFYRFHAEHMEEGNVVKGNFCVVSNHGEYYLPYVATVGYHVPESSVGPIKNLFHFTNLAKSNWQEAVNLFYSPEFLYVLGGSGSPLYDCYRGLSAHPHNEQNMEEFLIQINKKQKVDFLVKEKEIVYEGMPSASYDVAEAELTINRNGWGYTSLQVECEGEFVFTEKEVLTDDDFLGNYCRLPVFLDTGLCRRGKNYGQVFLYNSYVSITIPVTVKIGENKAARQVRVHRKRVIVQLMEFYLAFRLKKIGSGTWLKETAKLIEQLVSRDEKDVAARLFQAQLLISEEKYHEAGWILDHVVSLLEAGGEDNTLYAYYLYLTTLIQREEEYVDQAAQEVEQLYRRDRTNWRIAWLLLYLSEEYNKTPAAKWDFLVKQFHYGCSSPVLYIEALNLLAANPTLLRKLDAYSLQILYFGARQEVLGPEVVEQLLYLTGRGKEYSSLLLRLFQKLYEKNKDTRILQEICTLLIRGNLVGADYLNWYQAGVEAQLRITNLYEHYMMSVDLRTARTLPKMVLMYFSYQNNLDMAHSAFLYDYVWHHREELGELFESYRPKMEYFVVDQIQKGHINRHLAGLYKELLTPAMVNEQTARSLSKLLFAHQVVVKDMRMKKVIVYQPGNLQESVYPLWEGSAWMPLYGSDCTVLFEDAYGNRFMRNVEHTMEKLMIPGKYLRAVADVVKDSPALDLYLYETEKDKETWSGQELERAVRMTGYDCVDAGIRRECGLKVLRHYYEHDALAAVDDYLERLSAQDFSADEGAVLLKYMVLQGKYDAAWEWVKTFGPYQADPKTLLWLLGERIGGTDGVEDAVLTDMALFLFRTGKYDSKVIEYLSSYARGPVKELRNIWKAVRSFDMDAYWISERILLQLMFSGTYVGEQMEIFDYYVAQGGDTQIERAFLASCSYDYFVREKLTDDTVFRHICHLYQQDGDVQKICKLAFLKYYAENREEITQALLPVIGDFLQMMLADKIHLSFFRSFGELDFEQAYLLREMMDKTIVEYRARPGARAYIHYVILHENGEDSEYHTEVMREVYGGWCFKEFILFFGESLQYYIMEESGEQEQLTESGNLQKSDMKGKNGDWRYEMINDIIISKTLQEYDTLDSLLEEYYRREYLNEALFVLQ